MLMMGWLKDRVHRKKDYDDFEDIRSNVLGNDFARPEPDFPRPSAVDPLDRRFDSPLREPMGRLERQPPGRFDQPRFEEPPGFSSIDVRESQSSSSNYDILDRLNLIESQLSAIRSQTETINERLKNLETKLVGRRYL